MLLWPLLLNWGHENIILGWTPKWCLVGPQLSAGGGGCARHDARATRDLLQKRGLHYKNAVGRRDLLQKRGRPARERADPAFICRVPEQKGVFVDPQYFITLYDVAATEIHHRR